jgi:ketosteroid isomerase-like protein
MKKLKTNVVLLLSTVAFLFASCGKAPEAPKPINMDELKVEIQKLEDAFAAAEKAKDADAVVAYYSDDAISYGRNSEPSVGKAAIREKIAEGLAKDTTGSSNVYKVVDLFAEGDMVVEIGSWTEMDAAGAEVKKGFYMSYFQKRDGKYLCVRDMNVSTMPLTPAVADSTAAPM